LRVSYWAAVRAKAVADLLENVEPVGDDDRINRCDAKRNAHPVAQSIGRDETSMTKAALRIGLMAP
jgi:hypothetical protein